eukprot:7619290-Pyramimonas_sp.AAC.1
MSNVDIKILAAVFVCLVTHATQDLVGEAQKCVGGSDVIENLVRLEGWGPCRRLRVDRRALLCLTDPAPAAPALSRAWMFVAPQKMGTPPAIIHFFREIYRDQLAIITIAGQ